MIDFNTALRLAEAEISKRNINFIKDQLNKGRTKSDELILYPDFVLEKEFGWIFFWGSQLFYETKDHRYSLGGNAPFIVDSYTEQISYTGTAQSIESYIEAYEQKFQLWRLEIKKKFLDEVKYINGLKKVLNMSFPDLLEMKRREGTLVSIKQGGKQSLQKLQVELENIEILSDISWNR